LGRGSGGCPTTPPSGPGRWMGGAPPGWGSEPAEPGRALAAEGGGGLGRCGLEVACKCFIGGRVLSRSLFGVGESRPPTIVSVCSPTVAQDWSKGPHPSAGGRTDPGDRCPWVRDRRGLRDGGWGGPAAEGRPAPIVRRRRREAPAPHTLSGPRPSLRKGFLVCLLFFSGPPGLARKAVGRVLLRGLPAPPGQALGAVARARGVPCRETPHLPRLLRAPAPGFRG